MNLAQSLPQFLAHPGIQRAEGFVQQQHARFNRQGPGQSHTLPLAARQLAGVAVADVGQLDQFQQLRHTPGDLGTGRPGLARPRPQAIGNVFKHRHVPEQGIGLEHEARPPLLHGQAGGIHSIK